MVRSPAACSVARLTTGFFCVRFIFGDALLSPCPPCTMDSFTCGQTETHTVTWYLVFALLSCWPFDAWRLWFWPQARPQSQWEGSFIPKQDCCYFRSNHYMSILWQKREDIRFYNQCMCTYIHLHFTSDLVMLMFLKLSKLFSSTKTQIYFYSFVRGRMTFFFEIQNLHKRHNRICIAFRCVGVTEDWRRTGCWSGGSSRKKVYFDRASLSTFNKQLTWIWFSWDSCQCKSRARTCKNRSKQKVKEA